MTTNTTNIQRDNQLILAGLRAVQKFLETGYWPGRRQMDIMLGIDGTFESHSTAEAIEKLCEKITVSPAGAEHQPPGEKFLSGEIYVGPYSEAIEEHDRHRILYNGVEVATLSYCEDYRWASLYADAPWLVAALRRANQFIADVQQYGRPRGHVAVPSVIRDAVSKYSS